jgi:4-hydroxy-tetrahydrodipicolinate synthase
MAQITELLTQAPRTFHVFSGDDALALPTLAVGGTGLISVASNAIPQQMSQMIASALHDNWIAARRINRHYFNFMQALFTEPSPAPIKAALTLLGRGNENLRLPMVPVSATTRHRLETILGELGLLHDNPHDNLRTF